MFYFRLAEKLGKTVKQLLNEIDSAEITEWMALAKIDYQARQPKVQTADSIKSSFANKVIKKG